MNIQFYINRPHDSEYTEAEFPIVLDDFRRMIDIFVYLINTMAEEKLKDESWRYYSETLAIKYTLNANSLSQILGGSRLESSLSNVATNIIDLSSLFILMRAEIENYLTFYYLYIQPKTKSEQEYRFLIYELAGLTSRQKLNIVIPEVEAKKKEEEKRIDEIIQSLAQNRFFLSLDQVQQKKILKDRTAKLVGWNILVEQTELTSEVFRKLWKLSSNYAHSEYLSLMQIKEYLTKPHEVVSTRNLIQTMLMMLTCGFITDFSGLYPEIAQRFAKLPANDIRVIQLFTRTAKAQI